jgi:hypothetical protein
VWAQALGSAGWVLDVPPVQAGDDDGRCGGGTPIRMRSVKRALHWPHEMGLKDVKLVELFEDSTVAYGTYATST